MCMACVEYMKDKLTLNELKSNLRETTMGDADHQKAVEKIIQENAANPQELKRLLEALAKK